MIKFDNLLFHKSISQNPDIAVLGAVSQHHIKHNLNC